MGLRGSAGDEGSEAAEGDGRGWRAEGWQGQRTEDTRVWAGNAEGT